MDQITNGEWLKLFGNLDLGVMAAIGVVAWVAKRSAHISETLALLIPLALGGAWGIAEAYQNGYAPLAFVAKGALLNGAGATVVARLADATLVKLFAATPPPPTQG